MVEGKILLYEELAINAYPALQTQLYDGWVLRFANGYTNRANSINPLYKSSLGLDIKIAECEKRYFNKGLPSVYKLTDSTDKIIDKTLEKLGYEIVTPTYVMEMDLHGKDFTLENCAITPNADNEWFDSYFSFCDYTDKIKMTTAKQIFANVNNAMLCGRIVKDGISAACGSAVIERGYMALLNIVVDEKQRGKGYGTAICESLLAAAKQHCASTAYLQVVQDNDRAVNLYTKLGYKIVYSYWYRVKKEK